MKLYSSKRLAQELSVAPGQIRRWQKAGMPFLSAQVTDETGTTRRTYLHDLTECWGWLCDTGKARGTGVLKMMRELSGGLTGAPLEAFTRGYLAGQYGTAEWLATTPDEFDELRFTYLAQITPPEGE
jgi:hypothetical protein